MDIQEVVLGISKNKIKQAIRESKTVSTWGEFTKFKNYTNLNAGERIYVQGYYWDNVIKSSPKFKGLPLEEQTVIEKGWIKQNLKDIMVESFKNPRANSLFFKAMETGGKVVEEAAKIIEPKVPAGRTTAGIVFKDFPRQVIADMARYHKPWTILTLSTAHQLIKTGVKSAAHPLGKFIGKRLHPTIKANFLKYMTIGRGQPLGYRAAKLETKLKQLKGEREAMEIYQKLSTAPHDMRIVLRSGKAIMVKKGKPIPLETQRYIGRLLRKEVDVSGERMMTPEIGKKMFKNIEVEIASNLKIQKLQSELDFIKKALKSKEILAKGLARKDLLKQKKTVTKQLRASTLKIETEVRAKYKTYDKSFVEQIKSSQKFKESLSLAEEGRKVMDKWSQALIDSGIDKKGLKEVIEKNIGKYMLRTFKPKLKEQPPWKIFSPKNLRVRIPWLKKRQELSSAVLKRMGEIKEPALPIGIQTHRISRAVANDKLFQIVAGNTEWVAASDITGDMVKMSGSAALGALKNKWVIPSIADDINAIVLARPEAWRLYAKLLSAWKFMKIVPNPSTHSRNIMSNSALLDLSGTSQFQQARLIPKAFKEYLKKGSIYKNAIEDGAIGGEFVGSEIGKLEMFYRAGKGNHFTKIVNTLKAPFIKASNVYQAEEQIAKLVKYMDVLEKGGTRKVAAEQAQKHLFDYTDIPKFIEMAKHAAPFITFTYKAIPRVAEAIIENPLKVYKYYTFFKSWNEASRKMLNMSPVEFARQEKSLPPWLLRGIGGFPTNLLLPYKDKTNRTNWLNLEYILPLGMAPETLQKGVIRGFISNPFLNIYADLKANKDFAGKRICPPIATKLEAAKAVTQYIYRQIAPSFAVGLFDTKTGESIFKGGYSFEKVIGAIYKRPDLLGRTKGLTPALFDTLAGLKVTPLDIEEAQLFKALDTQKTMEELQREIMKLNHPVISEQYREKQADVIFKKMLNVLEEFAK